MVICSMLIECLRVKKTGEIYTPTDLVIKILKETDIKQFAMNKIVIDPTWRWSIVSAS